MCSEQSVDCFDWSGQSKQPVHSETPENNCRETGNLGSIIAKICSVVNFIFLERKEKREFGYKFNPQSRKGLRYAVLASN